MSHRVYLGLGTNLGDRLENLRAAIVALPPAVCPQACSPVYETPPWGFADQPLFLNQVVQGETDLAPQPLLEALKALEARLGRQPSFQYGPRLIDLDILLYDQLQIETPQLQVPHPRLAERAFVLLPLAALAPDLVHPVLGRAIKQLLVEVDTSEMRWRSPGECAPEA
jgi:2-amino-4-hydroxy-6-hydroxymethyldihydropteridine diphosphokinase